jgi:predicted metal-binding protein
MRIISWNCQGCGNPRTVRALKKLVAINKPDIVFLMETKQISSKSCFYLALWIVIALKLWIAPLLVEVELGV